MACAFALGLRLRWLAPSLACAFVGLRLRWLAPSHLACAFALGLRLRTWLVACAFALGLRLRLAFTAPSLPLVRLCCAIAAKIYCSRCARCVLVVGPAVVWKLPSTLPRLSAWVWMIAPWPSGQKKGLLRDPYILMSLASRMHRPNLNVDVEKWGALS